MAPKKPAAAKASTPSRSSSTSSAHVLSTAGDFAWSGPVVEIPSTATVAEALAVLTEHGLLSAPVYDAGAKKYLGMFDVSDVLSLVYGLDVLKSVVPVASRHEDSSGADGQVVVSGIRLDHAYVQGLEGTDIPVGKLLQKDGHTAPWWPVLPSASLLDVVKRLAAKVDLPWAPCRRVPVMDPKTGRVSKIISQSEMVNQIYRNVVEHRQTEPLFIQTPRTHKIGICAVATVDSHKDSAHKALELLINKRISSVPVLDEAGAPVEVITTKDIALLLKMKTLKEPGSETIDQLPALEFVQRLNAFVAQSGGKRSRFVAVSADTPIHAIVAALATNRTHRVYVVDKPNTAPVGVISVSDIVKLLLDEELPWPSAVLLEKVSSHAKDA